MRTEAGQQAKPIVRHDRIVITVPCFNEERWLGKTLESVRTQAMDDFAVLISDNASTDRTAEIAEEFARRDTRFHVHRHPKNIGAAANFNFAYQSTASPFFMWLGAHDCIQKTYLERTLPPLLGNVDISLAYAYSRMIDESGRPVAVGRAHSEVTGERELARFPRIGGAIARYFHSVRNGGFCIPINNIIRRDALQGTEFKGVYGGDRVLLARIAFGGAYYCIPEYLYLHRAFGPRTDDYMKRLTGNDDALADRNDFLRLFEDDFSQLLGQDPLKRVYIKVLREMLKYYYVPDASGLIPRAVRMFAKIKRGAFARRGL